MKRLRTLLRNILLGAFALVAGLYALCAISLLTLRYVNPLTTVVQIQRRVQAIRQHRPYHKRYEFIPLRQVSLNLQHAVVAAEDGRFRQHHGFDWIEMQKVVQDDLQHHRLGRGGSTITQQLVKNLFLGTERSFLRKGAEFALVPLAEAFLTKDRILELYLNVIEWGRGIYGAEAAAQFYYHVPASQLDREQSARLAAIIPAPLKRKPERMNEYRAVILDRMVKTGW
ncbi:MAG TPA: monofunctional biosynthetic peptidoglycan transglycosylase [Bryobacteraceae bacterium]|nr:monofunctional biosynthetic peptidoglycan transglycosylase [Bryobacteraceae bacterium]